MGARRGANMIHRIEVWCTIFVVLQAAYFALKRWCEYRDGEEERYYAEYKKWLAVRHQTSEDRRQKVEAHFDKWFVKMAKRRRGYVPPS